MSRVEKKNEEFVAKTFKQWFMDVGFALLACRLMHDGQTGARCLIKLTYALQPSGLSDLKQGKALVESFIMHYRKEMSSMNWVAKQECLPLDVNHLMKSRSLCLKDPALWRMCQKKECLIQQMLID
ncbi:unnamed protein product [Soboliphyme baturini]|uniref:Macro domain-containing protein n=1 Tax=Soboliphyme baturini TaxID=241478 RepID=A0A183IWX8_9BILA|nr:unnamed protein product [Soboliphyme baturini]